jgi:hypothetical protein
VRCAIGLERTDAPLFRVVRRQGWRGGRGRAQFIDDARIGPCNDEQVIPRVGRQTGAGAGSEAAVAGPHCPCGIGVLGEGGERHQGGGIVGIRDPGRGVDDGVGVGAIVGHCESPEPPTQEGRRRLVVRAVEDVIEIRHHLSGVSGGAIRQIVGIGGARLRQGALGTLLDGRGNDFDQAALLVALLRQAGYTASYVYGQIRLSPTQLTNWLGVDTSNPCTVSTLLGHGGIPVTLNVSGPLDCTGTLVSADIAHVWVSVTGGSLGTTTYVYDPSFKTMTTPTTGINLASAMGYSQSSFLATAESGATLTTNSIQNVNTANLQNALTGYTNNLVSYIKTNMPTATLKEVVGGTYIQPLTQPYTPQTSLPYETPGDTPQTWTGDVPNQYRTTLEIVIGGIDQTYYADQIYGHRLSLVYNASNQPVLYLDGVVQATGSANANTVTYNVNFPFCFATSGSASAVCGSSGGVNYTNIFTCQTVLQATTGYSYAIVNGWDFSGRGMVEFHRRQLQANQAAGNSAGSEPVLGEALNMIGYAWLAQLSALQTSRAASSARKWSRTARSVWWARWPDPTSIFPAGSLERRA